MEEEVRLPSEEELAKLPHEFIVAYAVRNALRVFPLIGMNFIMYEITLIPCITGLGWAALYTVTKRANLKQRRLYQSAAEVAANASFIPNVIKSNVAKVAIEAASAAAYSTSAEIIAARKIVSTHSIIAKAEITTHASQDFATLSSFQNIDPPLPIYQLPLGVEEESWYQEALTSFENVLVHQDLRWILDVYLRLIVGRIDDELATILRQNAPEFLTPPSTNNDNPPVNRPTTKRATKKASPQKRPPITLSEHQEPDFIDDSEEETTIFPPIDELIALEPPLPTIKIPRPPENVSTVDDAPASRDLLGFTRYVDSFAKIIASADTKLPLSIGLYGNWGSGKSSFMLQLREKLQKFTSAGSDRFVKKIIPIEFNAWHYIDSNIWASLATGIFDGIAASEEGSTTTSPLAAAQQKLHEQLTSTQDAKHFAEQQKEVLKKKLVLAQSVTAIRAVYDAFVNNKLLGRQQTFEEFIDAVDNDTMTKANIRNNAILLAVALVVALLAFIGIHYAPFTKGSMAKIISVITASVPFTIAGFAFIRKILKNATFKKLFTEAKKLTTSLATQSDNAKKLNEQLDNSTLNIEKLTQQIGEVETALRRLETGGLIYDHIRSSALNPVYGNNLSLIATLRKDLESLGKIIADYNQSSRDSFRIVVYIDDLDRCPPQLVVDVLQAIHLLLAFPFFVVVAGVDHRWLEGSLNKIYLGSGVDMGSDHEFREFCPQNYLEKIFQLNFNVPAMNSGFDDFVRSLVPVEAPEVGLQGRITGDERIGLPELLQHPPEQQQPPATQKNQDLAATSITDSANVKLPEPESSEPELIKKNLTEFEIVDKFRAQELDVLNSLKPLLRTPRLVKRLINIYRILRAAIPASEFEAFLTQEHRDVLLLLSISVGFQRVGSLLLYDLEQCSVADFQKNGLLWRSKELKLPNNSSGSSAKNKFTEEIKSLTEALALLGTLPADLNLEVVQKYLPEIRRFSYQREDLL